MPEFTYRWRHRLLSAALSLAFLPSSAPAAESLNQLGRSEVLSGWKLLFDGQSTEGWRNYRQDKVSEGWKVVDGIMCCSSSEGAM